MRPDVVALRRKLGMEVQATSVERQKRKRKRALAPRAKRMNRSARLQSARSWLKTYTGENIVAGYRKHFGIDWFCAFKELETLGVKIDDEYKNKLLKTLAGSVAARRRREIRRKKAFCASFDQDETFSYIAGYTQAGFAYGVTWEEWERLNQADLIDPNGDSNNTSDDDSQKLPF